MIVRKRILLPLLLSLIALGCVQHQSQKFTATLKNVDVRLVDSNSSSVKLQFRSYVERFEKTNCTLYTIVRLGRTNIEVWRKSINASGDKGTSVYTINATFDRDKEYFVIIVLKRDGRVLGGRSFFLHDLNQIPNLSLGMKLTGADFLVRGVNGSHANVECRFYLRADKRLKGIDFHIKAKPLGTNLLADERWVRNVSIAPGRVETLTCELRIPKDYNYLVTVEVWKNGSIEAIWNEPLVLNPTKPKPSVNRTTGKNFSLSDFVVNRPIPVPRPVTTKKGPGFTILAVLCAFSIILWKRRRR